MADELPPPPSDEPPIGGPPADPESAEPPQQEGEPATEWAIDEHQLRVIATAAYCYNLRQIAAWLGVDVSNLSRMLNGHSQPSSALLAAAFGRMGPDGFARVFHVVAVAA